jgi:signal transduction histidine kinase/CheY-like chemotaxis protein
MNLAQAMPQAQADLFLQSISICIDQGTYNFSFETNTEGLITNFETRLSKVNETEAILLVRDVTLDKYQQDLLRHAIDRAEKANQAKSEFLANMSHEIRTPMNGVIGMASLLSKSVMTEEQREMVDTIRNSGDLLLSIINDILDFSKIESGNMELEKGQIDLRLILEEVTDQFSARLNQKDLYFSYFIDPAIRTIVLGDRIRMHQILVNLIGNAIKFTREGGIEIRVWPGEVVNGKTQINFSILDTGIGIPEDKIQMLFKPFSQLNSSNNRQYTGTGLGLAITARLVKLMDGEIGVTSRANHGSDFHFHVMMDTTEKQDFIESAPVKGIAILNDVDTPWLHHQIDHFLDVVQAARVTEYTQGTLVITDKEQQSYPPENTILTGVTWSFDESAVTSRTLALPLKLSTFLKAISEDRLYCKTKTVEVPDPEDLFSQYPLKILVAEDNRTNQKLMIQTLNYFGYMPGLSKNGQEVLDALKNEHYDLIFMDIQMPEMDGLEATRIVKRTYKTNRPVIIAMTASALMEEKELCFMAGVDDYLSKPAKIENIGDMIHKWGTMILQKRILI